MTRTFPILSKKLEGVELEREKTKFLQGEADRIKTDEQRKSVIMTEFQSTEQSTQSALRKVSRLDATTDIGSLTSENELIASRISQLEQDEATKLQDLADAKTALEQKQSQVATLLENVAQMREDAETLPLKDDIRAATVSIILDDANVYCGDGTDLIPGSMPKCCAAGWDYDMNQSVCVKTSAQIQREADEDADLAAWQSFEETSNTDVYEEVLSTKGPEFCAPGTEFKYALGGIAKCCPNGWNTEDENCLLADPGTAGVCGDGTVFSDVEGKCIPSGVECGDGTRYFPEENVCCAEGWLPVDGVCVMQAYEQDLLPFVQQYQDLAASVESLRDDVEQRRARKRLADGEESATCGAGTVAMGNLCVVQCGEGQRYDDEQKECVPRWVTDAS